MKKVLACIITGLALISLASCQQTQIDYTLHDTTVVSDSSLAIVNNWLNRETTKMMDTPILGRDNLTASGVEVYLPQDMLNSSRYTVTNLENSVYNGSETGDKWHHDLFESLSFTYLSMYANLNLDTVSSQIQEAEEDIKQAFSLVLETRELTRVCSVPESELKDVTYVAEQERSLVVLYLPVLIEAYTAQQDNTQNAILTIRTFVLVPLYYEISYAKDNKLSSDNKIATNFTQTSLSVSGTTIIG